MHTLVELSLRPYQLDVTKWMFDRGHGALFADLGTGKTVIALTYLETLRYLGQLRRALIIAPKNVCLYVWPDEIKKFSLYSRLKPSLRFSHDANIHLINPESLHKVPDWLIYDTLIIDESQGFKQHRAPKAAKKKALEAILKNPACAPYRGKCRFELIQGKLGLFKRRFILTGGPTPHSLMDLWTQIYIADMGRRLGRNISEYRRAYFWKGGYKGKSWCPMPESLDRVQSRISDICYRIDRRDHLNLPELIEVEIPVHLPDGIMKKYRKFERDLFLELENTEITVFNKMLVYQKCRQFTGGFIYDHTKDDRGKVVEKKTVWIHNEKLNALSDLHNRINRAPLLVLYQFEAEGHAIRNKFKCPLIDGSTSKTRTGEILKQWNSKNLPILAAQISTVSVGLNLQFGGRHMVFYSIPNKYGDYYQACGRLHRPGIDGDVTIAHLVCRGTVDTASLVPGLREKGDTQDSLLDNLNKYRKEVLESR